jgi:hypothetical protein
MDFSQGRVKAQVASHRPITAKVRVRSQVHVVFVVDKVELTRFLSHYFRFPPVTAVPPMQRSHLQLDTTVGEGQRAKLWNPPMLFRTEQYFRFMSVFETLI